LLLEEFRYHVNNQSDLSAELLLYKDPAALSLLGFPISNFTHVELPSQFVFVTAADYSFFHTVMDAIALIQLFYPNTSIYFYDLSDGVLDIKADKVNMCCYLCCINNNNNNNHCLTAFVRGQPGKAGTRRNTLPSALA